MSCTNSKDQTSIDTNAAKVPFEDAVHEAPLGGPLEPSTSTASNSFGSRPKCFNSLASECLFVLTTTFAIGQVSILNGVLLVMTSRMQEGLSMNSSEVTWLIAGPSLTSGAFLLFFGRVADLFGRRLQLISSMVLFTVCMFVTGFSQSAMMAEIFLALSGVACAAVVPPAIGKLGAIYERPSPRKNRAFACFSAGNPLGFALGALIGGIFNHISTWRACFWCVTVIYAAFTTAAYFTTPEDSEQRLGGLNMYTLKQMDWLGALLAVSGIALFTAAFTLAPDVETGWKTPYIIVMLVLGVILLSAFLYWQSIFKHPLMPLGVWKDKNFSLLVASLCLAFYGFNENFFWAALGWQRTYLDSPLKVAVKSLPMAICGVLANIGAALLMHRVSNKLLSICAAAASLAACALWSATSKDTSFWALTFPAQLSSVIGADIAFCVTNLYVMSALPPDKQSVAGGMFQTTTRLAATLGLGVSTTVYAAAGGTLEVGLDVPWRPYQSTFWVGLVGAVLGLILTFFLTIGKQGQRQTPRNTELIAVESGKMSTKV